MARQRTSELLDEELAATVDLVADFDETDWERPTLCTEWTVRDVVQHIAFHTHRAGVRQLLANSDKLLPKLTAEAGADTIDGLKGWLASRPADSARASIINLCELVIHQEDVRRPLNRPRRYPDATMRACLDHCISIRGNLLVIGERHRRGRDLHLVATDLGWTSGKGPDVEGPAEAILMAIAGRPAALDDLSGAGLSTLATRMPPTPQPAS